MNSAANMPSRPAPTATHTTVVSTQGNQTTVSTQSLRDGNAFSTYSNFAVGQGDQVKMLVPKDANWWVNIVRDAQVRVDGRLESRLANGNIGGNLLFIDSHGFAVGPKGQIDRAARPLTGNALLVTLGSDAQPSRYSPAFFATAAGPSAGAGLHPEPRVQAQRAGRITR